MARWTDQTAYPVVPELEDDDRLPILDVSETGSEGGEQRQVTVGLLRALLGSALTTIRVEAGDYTLSAGDLGAHIRFTGPATGTIPEGLPVGWACAIENATVSDTVDLGAEAGVTLLSAGTQVTNGKIVAVIVVAPNVALAVGAFADEASSPGALDDLTDVDTTGVADGDRLGYDSGTSTWVPVAPSAGDGDVVGPASSVADRIAVFDGESGKAIKDGGALVGDLATKAVSINAQTGTTYTLVLGDAGKLVTLANADPVTVTVPLNSSVDFPVGTVIALQQLGVGAVSVEGPSGVTINGTDPGDEALTDARYLTTAVLTQHADNVWTLTGSVA